MDSETLKNLGINILSTTMAIPIIAILGWFIYYCLRKFQFGRFIVWWWRSGHQIRVSSNTIVGWYKTIKKAIPIVANNLGIMRTFQGSPAAMPLATCSKEFHKYVINMAWLILQGKSSLLEKITTKYYMRNGETYYETTENQSAFDQWATNLLISYENDASQIFFMEYNDFMWVFSTSLNKVA